MQATIRRHGASIKLVSLQFISLAAVGMIAPYINLYLIDSGLSATWVGTLTSVGAILTLSLTPWLNHLADKYLKHRRLLMAYLLLFALACAIFASSGQVILLVVAFLLLAISISPSLSLSMQLTMQLVATRAKSVLGQVRSFAALGFAVASLFAGQLFEWGGYTVLFWSGAAFALLTTQVATIFPAQATPTKVQPLAQGFKRSRKFYVLIATQFFVMMGISNAFSFTFIHFTENIGMPTSSIGFWAFVMAGVEVPFFILFDRFLPRVSSRLVYLVGMIGMAIFLVSLGVVGSQWMIFWLFVFRGVFWPMMHLASYRLVAEISESHNVATNQAIVQVTMPSLARLLTGTAFGWMFDNWSVLTFFAMCALTAAIGIGIMVVGYRWFEEES